MGCYVFFRGFKNRGDHAVSTVGVGTPGKLLIYNYR